MGLGGGQARRLSLGAAITFAVAATAGVAGNRLTGRVTPALLVFAALVAAGMVLSYWIDRRGRQKNPTEGQGSGSATGSSPLNDLPSFQQNIIAAAPGAIAQGAIGGNVINHEDVAQSGLAGSARSDPAAEERDGQQ